MPLYNGRFIQRIVILTGAGTSAESGLPTFRDPQGIWEQHDPMDLATPQAFQRDPALVYRFYNSRRSLLHKVEPNAAHAAIARLQREFQGDIFLVSQNVDDLHERAGSTQVCHMHGELLAALCTACSRSMRMHDDYDRGTACPVCGTVGSLRPDVVWFGEMPYFMDEIEAQLADCDLFVAIGTSGLVYPAAGFVQRALAAGATTVEINPAASDVAQLFQQQLRGPASVEVPALVQELLAS
jgi:NAD-dependent deacetylase